MSRGIKLFWLGRMKETSFGGFGWYCMAESYFYLYQYSTKYMSIRRDQMQHLLALSLALWSQSDAVNKHRLRARLEDEFDCAVQNDDTLSHPHSNFKLALRVGKANPVPWDAQLAGTTTVLQERQLCDICRG
jgi:hypothetical protein